MADTSLNPIWNDPNGLDFTSDTQVGSLPIRGEKKLVPVELASTKTNSQAQKEAAALADSGDTTSEATGTTPTYEAITYAKTTLTDYVTLRIPTRPARGKSQGVFTYRFLINPKSVQVSRQTMDAHSMTRAGWQFGIWGEDTIDIHVSGTTAGQYFENGLSDRWEEFSVSYRNTMELVNLFENNGYFFEGEETDNQWSAPDYTRRRIKSQGDVELRVGNFIWSGMFVSMALNHTADTPYFNTFEFNFLAWKERFTDASPWLDTIHNSVTRGHDATVSQQLATNYTQSSVLPPPDGWSSAPQAGVPLPGGWSSSLLAAPNLTYPMSSGLSTLPK